MPRYRSAWLSHGFCCDRKQTQSGLVVPADLISATIEDKARGTAGTNWPALSFPMIFALDPFWRVSEKVFGYQHHIQQNEQDWWLEFFISIGWKRVAEFCFFLWPIHSSFVWYVLKYLSVLLKSHFDNVILKIVPRDSKCLKEFWKGQILTTRLLHWASRALTKLKSVQSEDTAVN